MSGEENFARLDDELIQVLDEIIEEATRQNIMATTTDQLKAKLCAMGVKKYCPKAHA